MNYVHSKLNKYKNYFKILDPIIKRKTFRNKIKKLESIPLQINYYRK